MLQDYIGVEIVISWEISVVETSVAHSFFLDNIF